jgi:hypothetical protein
MRIVPLCGAYTAVLLHDEETWFMANRTFRRIVLRASGALIVLALLATLAPTLVPTAAAQTEERFFPETGYSIKGAFRLFWEANGGVDVFGYPITWEYTSRRTGRLTQYFERARFELTERDGDAYVELGRLGVEVTNGREFPKVPPIENTDDRRYIDETGHIIQYGFKEIWETRGDVRIFGYPISEEILEPFEDGQWRTVQYFERARFEYWPDFPPGERVLLTNLGRWLAPSDSAVSDGGGDTSASVPPGRNARVVPEVGAPGTTFRFEAQGFEPGEQVGVWVTAPDQSTFDAGFQVEADGNGSITNEAVGLTATDDFIDGVWSFNAQGIESGNEAVGYFRIVRSSGGASLPPPNEPIPPAGNPALLGTISHDELLRQGQAHVLPLAAPPGTAFELVAQGYRPGEAINSWITAPDNTSSTIAPGRISLGADGVAHVRVSGSSLPAGTYTAVAEGAQSSVMNAAAFRVTTDYVAGPGTTRPVSINGTATPAQGGLQTVFQIRGRDLQPGELLEFWTTEPDGVYTLFPLDVRADSQGRIGYDPRLDLNTTGTFLPGVYGVHFRGTQSGTRVAIYFTYTGAATQAQELPTLFPQATSASPATAAPARGFVPALYDLLR